LTWSQPRTWVTGEVVTAAEMNQEVRDNLLALQPTESKDAPGGAGGTTTSSTFGDLTGVSAGPAVAVSTLTEVTCLITCQFSLNAVPTSGTYGVCAVQVSGATTLAASDDNGLLLPNPVQNQPSRSSAVVRITGLTPGANTFTLKFRVNPAGNTGTFSRRELEVIAG